jgi:hypothetical protein
MKVLNVQWDDRLGRSVTSAEIFLSEFRWWQPQSLPSHRVRDFLGDDGIVDEGAGRIQLLDAQLLC